MSQWRAALAARAPVPVFVAACVGGGETARQLIGRDGIEVVASPRHASLLLVAGGITPALTDPLTQVHDQLPHPRATIWSSGAPDEALWPTLPSTVPAIAADPVPLLVERYAALLRGDIASEPDLLPDRPANAWDGVGPFGQGGEGMMGGTPYGRPMAMTGADRDGLALDQLHLTVGPFLPGLPVGLALDVVLQGELVQEVSSASNLATAAPSMRGAGVDADDAVFRRAMNEPVPIAELERARARHHLGALAGALHLSGLPALATVAARLAAMPRPPARQVDRLARHVARSGLTSWAGSGLGVIAADEAVTIGGPTARSAGLPNDVRGEDNVYLRLGFEPITGHMSDVAGRWRQRLAEVAQSLTLAERAEQRGANAAVGAVGAVEAPEGTRSHDGDPPTPILELLPELLSGRDWDELVATIASLDLRLAVAELPKATAWT